MGDRTQREVRISADCLAKARSSYPVDGSSSGRPSLSRFEDTILKAAIFQFAHGFDELPEAVPGVAIRAVITDAVPFFPATVFYGVLGGDDAVEIIDFVDDPEYFELLDDDPDD